MARQLKALAVFTENPGSVPIYTQQLTTMCNSSPADLMPYSGLLKYLISLHMRQNNKHTK